MLDERTDVYTTHGLHTAMQGSTQKQAENVLAEVRRIQQAITKESPGPARARMLYAAMDQAIEDDRKRTPRKYKKIQCKAGCSSCCHLLIEVTPDEAELLAERALTDVRIDMGRLSRQAERKDVGDYFRKAKWEDSACVFLSNGGNCRIYSDRPMACRKYFVSSPPASCAPTPSGKAQTVGFVPAIEAEIIATAALDLDRPTKHMAAMLLERLT